MWQANRYLKECFDLGTTHLFTVASVDLAQHEKTGISLCGILLALKSHFFLIQTTEMVCNGVFGRSRCVVTESELVSWPPIYCKNSDCPSNMYCKNDYGDPNYHKSGFDNFGQAFVVLMEISMYGMDTLQYAQIAFSPGSVPVFFYFSVIVVVALVVNNLFVALVCFGFSQARAEIARELELMQSMDGNNDGILPSINYNALPCTRFALDLERRHILQARIQILFVAEPCGHCS